MNVTHDDHTFYCTSFSRFRDHVISWVDQVNDCCQKCVNCLIKRSKKILYYCKGTCAMSPRISLNIVKYNKLSLSSITKANKS